MRGSPHAIAMNGRLVMSAENSNNGVLHNTAICELVREEIRKHKVCDGSGHLYLYGIARPLTNEKIEIVVTDVLAAFHKRGVNIPNGELVRTQIWGILTSLVKRKKPPEKKSGTNKPKGRPPQWQP